MFSRVLRTTAAAAALATTLVLTPGIAARASGTESKVPLSECHHSDARRPTWGEPVLSTDTVDVTDGPATVTITMPVTDKGGPGPAVGVESVWVDIVGPHVELTRGEGDEWTGSFVVPRKTRPGRYFVSEVSARDIAGNWRRKSYNSSSREPTYGPVLEVIGPPVPTPPDPLPVPQVISLSASTDQVDVTKRAATVGFLLEVDESEATVSRARMRFHARPTRSVRLTRTAEGFVGETTIEHGWPGTFTARVRDVVLTDTYGIEHWVRVDKDLVRVIGRKDKGLPRLVSATVTPSPIDVRTSSQEVTIDVRARDKVSGVGSVEFSLLARNFHRRGIAERHLEFKLVEGTRKQGTWRATVTVSPCDMIYRWASVWIEDRAGNKNWDIPDVRVNVRSNDLKRPKARWLNHETWANGPRFRFTERVTGVNPDSFQVRRYDGDSWSSPLKGRLECRGEDAAPVGCGSTKVMQAHWTPDTGELEAGRSYRVRLNPRGNLDIRDLAGNPLFRDEVGFTPR